MSPENPDLTGTLRSKPDILLAGCGRMGSALLAGWCRQKIAGRIAVIEPNDVRDLPDGVEQFRSSESFAASNFRPDILVLAVKPQIMKAVCSVLSPHIGKETLILSIAAGCSLSFFQEAFGESQPVVRAMPNTPAAIGRGITVACAGPKTTQEQKQTTTLLLESTGSVQWIDSEARMHAVTALSGGGPAYVFLLIETLAKAGEQLGLPADLSMILARQTVIGSAALAASEPDHAPETLRKNVTSPGGTTQEALKILMDEDRIQTLFSQALAAAAKRSEELGS